MFQKPWQIPIVLTYTHRSATAIQHSDVSETGLSDFHLLTVTEFKMEFQN